MSIYYANIKVRVTAMDGSIVGETEWTCTKGDTAQEFFDNNGVDPKKYNITINGKRVKESYEVQPFDKVEIRLTKDINEYEGVSA